MYTDSPLFNSKVKPCSPSLTEKSTVNTSLTKYDFRSTFTVFWHYFPGTIKDSSSLREVRFTILCFQSWKACKRLAFLRALDGPILFQERDLPNLKAEERAVFTSSGSCMVHVYDITCNVLLLPLIASTTEQLYVWSWNSLLRTAFQLKET